MSTRLILVHQQKGGVGKTFLSVHLATFLNRVGVPVKPVDFDVGPRALSRIFPYPQSLNVNPSIARLLEGESHMPALMERVIAGERFLFDCGSGTGEFWERLIFHTCAGLPERFERADVKVTLVVPVDGDPASRDAFDKYRELFPKAALVLVLFRRAKSTSFPLPSTTPDVAIDFPFAPEALFAAYRDRNASVDSLAALPRGAGSDPVPAMARVYLPTLHREFQRFQHLLL